MRIIYGNTFDGFNNYITQNKDSTELTTFRWRDTLAEYNPNTKELTLVMENIALINWAAHPEDAALFAKWMADCQKHFNWGHNPPENVNLN